MPLAAPNLDDRDFASLFREVRSRIPEYLPEWTDWNDSDPGITLLQLYCWLTETVLYRLNQLPDLHYVKFLQLLGVEQHPAQPAKADLTFLLKETFPAPETLIPQGTVVAVAERDLPEPVFFETERTLTAISARLTALLQVTPAGDARDVSHANDADGRAFRPFCGEYREDLDACADDAGAAVGAAFVLGFASALPFSREEVVLHVVLAEEGRTLLASPPEAACEPVEDEEQPRLLWEWWDGTGWAPLEVTGDDSRGLTQSGPVYLRVPGQIPAVSSSAAGLGAHREDLLYWLRVRFVGGSYRTPPSIDRVLPNTIRAAAARTVSNEVVATGTGRPNQVMSLANAPVLADPPLELEVPEAGRVERWEQVPDLSASGPESRHYVFDRATGRITFGDGLRGRIPPAEAEPIVARRYRHGGGRVGNVGAHTITDLLTPIRDVDTVTNVRPAAGGEDEERLEDTRLRAPREVLKARDRAVTLEDFEVLATETPGALVGRAHADVVVEHGTDEAGRTCERRVVRVTVLPQGGGAKPVPSERALRMVCRYLDARRLLTTRLRVGGPRYRDVDVLVDARAAADADLRAVRSAVEDRLRGYFEPLGGGPEGRGLEFGVPVAYSQLVHEIMVVPGVRRLAALRFRVLLRAYASHEAATAGLPDDVAQERARHGDRCELEGHLLRVPVPSGDGEVEVTSYTAAVSDCCDLALDAGELPALRTSEVSVSYDRRGGDA